MKLPIRDPARRAIETYFLLSKREWIWTITIGVVLSIGINVAFGIIRIHECTWMCEYLLCLEACK